MFGEKEEMLDGVSLDIVSSFRDVALYCLSLESIYQCNANSAQVDPNTGVTLWESGAILEYLQETYDKSNQFQGSGNDKFLVKTWLHFQVSCWYLTISQFVVSKG